MSAAPAEHRQIVARREGRLGHLTLNRPERINALNMSMVRALATALRGWIDDENVDVVLIDGAGPRGLCAGGDIREVYEGIHGRSVAPGMFWSSEYEMNAMIAHYPKPVVTFMDGIVFGGGVGVSAHAGIRIVTERSQVAMPETAIGLSPDVGALYLLARSPGRLGVHCALTGARLDGAQAIHAGLADHLLDSTELPALARQLQSGQLPALPLPPHDSHPSWIDDCYAVDDVETIGDRLSASDEPTARAAGATLCRMSPTALKVALEAVRRAAGMTLDEVLDQDLRVGSHFLSSHDFPEGIRAQIIDKDRNPSWCPAQLADIDRAQVLSYFEPIG